MTQCRCEHPGHPTWHNFDCPVGLHTSDAVLPPVDTEAVQVLRALVAMNKALIAREPPVLPAPVVVVRETPTERWAGATLERFRAEILREYRASRREFSRVPGATMAGSRALWRLSDLHSQEFRALVTDEMSKDEPRQDAA